VTTGVDAFVQQLAAFADAVDAIALDSAGAKSMRVVLAPRSPAATRLRLDDVVDAETAAVSLGTAGAACMFAGEFELDPRWSWRLESMPSSHLVAIVGAQIRSLARGLGRSRTRCAHQLSLGDELDTELAALVQHAATFELVCSEQLTCCGTGLYVVERPETFVLLVLYAFC
jgi:hypothetical protein